MPYLGYEPSKVAVTVGQGVIDATHIQDASITTADLSNDSVTPIKIDDDATGFQMGSLGLGTAVSGSEKLTVNGDVNFDSNTLFVDASANAVGIGTATPTNALLEVKTDNENIARFDGLQGNIDFRYGSDIEFDRAGQVYITANNASGELNFRTGGQNIAMHIDSSQQVGIGTTSPNSLVHAKVTTNTSETIRIQNDDSLTTLGVSSDGYSFHTYQHSLYLASWDGSTWSTKARWDNNGNLGIGHLSPQFGLTLAEGDLDANSIGWESSGNVKRGSIRMNPADYMKFNIGGGDRFWIGNASNNWTLNVTGNSPYGMQITTTASNSSSHDMFVLKRGDGTRVFEVYGDGNAYSSNEFISDSGFRSKGTSGAAPTGDDHHNVPIKMVAYRKTVSATDVTNGYIDFDTDIYRDYIISGITNHFGAAATNVNNIGYNPGYGHSLHFYAGGGCRLYFGGSVVQNDKMGIVLFFYGNTG